MADNGIKQIRIKQTDLPPLLVDTESYVIKYRIVSDDKNQLSHWSPVINLIPGYTFSSGSLAFNKAGGIASIVWDAVSIYKESVLVRQATEYDIWLQWDRNDGGDWIYKERTQTTSLSIPIPSTYTISGIIQPSTPNRLHVEIYLKGIPISRSSTFLRVYSGGPYTV